MMLSNEKIIYQIITLSLCIHAMNDDHFGKPLHYHYPLFLSPFFLHWEKYSMNASMINDTFLSQSHGKKTFYKYSNDPLPTRCFPLFAKLIKIPNVVSPI